MAVATDELVLLERVFLCLGSAETDEQLQSSICRFLPPVLLKLSSPQESVRTKVMALLIHINKRVKSRAKVQLPVEALLLQYQDPAASSFVINFTIIYIKLGYPRMEMEKQAELIPCVLNAIDGKPQSHQDSLLLVIMPALGHYKTPKNSENSSDLAALKGKGSVANRLLNFILDMLLLPYGSIGSAAVTSNDNTMPASVAPAAPAATVSVPNGLSEHAFKRFIGESIQITAEQHEQVKLGIVKFLGGGFFNESAILVQLIVAAADTRFSVANLADSVLRGIVSSLDWSSMAVALPMYRLFLGSHGFVDQRNLKPEMKRLPANTRIRLKIAHYLCRVSKDGLVFPAAVQVIFDSLFGTNTNKKLKSLALTFALNVVQQCSLSPLSPYGTLILNGMIKYIAVGDPEHRSMAYKIIGQLGQRNPTLVNKDSSLVQKFFEALLTTDGELRQTIRDALVAMSSSFVLDRDNKQGIILMNSLLSTHMESDEPMVRYVALHYAATVFPPDDIPSRHLLLLATGDDKNDVSIQALNALYGSFHRHKETTETKNTKEYILPDFREIVLYIKSQAEERISMKKVLQIGNHVIPYNLITFNEIVTYLRLCLAKSANISMKSVEENSNRIGKNSIRSSDFMDNHPNENSPILVRYWKEQLLENNTKYIDAYLDLLMPLTHANAEKIPLNALLEIIGTIPIAMTQRFIKELSWLKGLIGSTKADVRELAARIYAIIITHNSTREEFEAQISEFINATTKTKALEVQHGALFVLIYMVEQKLLQIHNEQISMDEKDKLTNWSIYSTSIEIICSFLENPTTMNPILIDAAILGIGIIGKTSSLPLPNDDNGGEGKNKIKGKKQVVENLFSILKNAKINHKIRENAVTSLGLLCIGEETFPFTKTIVENFIGLVKETKDVSMHFTIADALVYCVQGQTAPEARNAWTVLPTEHEQKFKELTQTNVDHLVFLLDKLLNMVSDPHPNSRQAVCIWLLAIVKRNPTRKAILERLPAIQSAFMNFLSENNEIVQEVGAKGICLVYETSKGSDRNALVSNLMSQFSDGRREVASVNPDTPLFEEGALGTSPTGGSISTYKEICSLASDLNNPDLIYKFLQLANHNAIWTSKKGAAYGFSAIASIAKDELDKHLPVIVPKLYRYQFDPTPKTQQNMAAIWHALVPSTQKALEQYHDEIMDDLTVNLTDRQWRVRFSCCHALSDLLKSNAPINFAKRAPELWKQLFLVMDDVHEDTRLTAVKTAILFGKICVKQCDPMYGKSSELVLQAILPIFLNIGIVHTVGTVRILSLQTVGEFASTAGPILKPSLIQLIPALLTAQDDLDNTRMTTTGKSDYITETMKKCTQYIDGPILKELMPEVTELIKSCLGLGSLADISQFLIFLSVQLKKELQPYTGKILTALMNRLTDRNAVVRKTVAMTIGHVIGSAKESSIEKLFTTLNRWYMEREDDSIRLAIGQALQSISNHNSEILKNQVNIVIPLTFFAMHVIKTPSNENAIELWTELWNEIAHGTEFAIKQNLTIIASTLAKALESASWTTKAQAANAISTVATKVGGSSMDDNTRTNLLTILTSGLQGRIWNGKEMLIHALATLTCHSKDALSNNSKLTTIITDALYNESKKENLEYRRHALQAFANVLQDLEIDRFNQLYDIAQAILIKLAKKNADSDTDSDDGNRATEESRKKAENQIKLQEVVYESLGKAWPSNIESKSTQDKYCLQFVAHCDETLPNSTRPIQVAIITTLNRYVEKLIILKMESNKLSETDKENLMKICETLYHILKVSLAISKYTRIRKEALNIILILIKRFIDGGEGSAKQLEALKVLFCQLLPELTQDNQPEVRTRVVDIKTLLGI